MRPQVHARRPVLLTLVFGAFVALIGITASAQAMMVSTHFATSTLNDVVGSDAALTRAFVNAYVEPPAFGDGLDAAARRRLKDQLGTLIRRGEIIRVELRRPDGSLVAADDPGAATRAAVEGDFAVAAAGGPRAAIVAPEADAIAGSAAGSQRIVEHLPMLVESRVVGVVTIWREAAPVLARLADVQRDITMLTLAAAMVAALLLYLIFRAAQGRLSRQAAALAEAARTDALTGILNHGAMVTHLAAAIETARGTGTPIGVALVDIDGFRLFNDHHGHAAGDEALLAVVSILSRDLPDAIAVGRYGPDELLLVAPAQLVERLETILEGLRAGLADVSLQFEATERLPVTFSAGICTYPEHGASVTALLAAVAGVLEEAKASGGDVIRVAGPPDADQESRRASGFDVLQGLVLAVDTKDRYTKRHSEDVARYAVFLAGELGLDPDTIRTIETAGLLHDVGKIGIPDEILRKPGRLTDAEYRVVQQHVALGDMIVRDLPDIAVVRSAIRHHHERWDGEGYLDRLAADAIPLAARILAVADAFSAMTTTRPYRKALDVTVALRRLEDAAGSQLDERLVRAFIRGIETHASPPLPGDGRPLRAVRAPVDRVA